MRIAHGEQRDVFAAGGRAPRDGRRGQAGGVRAQLSTLRGQQPVQQQGFAICNSMSNYCNSRGIAFKQ